jgi:hypothetical protein
MEDATFWENMQTLEQSASTIEENYKAFVSAASSLIIILFTSTQSNTMQKSQWRSLNDALWNAMFSAPQYTIVIIVEASKRA